VALGDQPAVIEDAEAIDELDHRLHRVLDYQHRHAFTLNLPDHAEDVGDPARENPSCDASLTFLWW
jgi:hypothetical protein